MVLKKKTIGRPYVLCREVFFRSNIHFVVFDDSIQNSAYLRTRFIVRTQHKLMYFAHFGFTIDPKCHPLYILNNVLGMRYGGLH